MNTVERANPLPPVYLPPQDISVYVFSKDTALVALVTEKSSKYDSKLEGNRPGKKL